MTLPVREVIYFYDDGQGCEAERHCDMAERMEQAVSVADGAAALTELGALLGGGLLTTAEVQRRAVSFVADLLAGRLGQ